MPDTIENVLRYGVELTKHTKKTYLNTLFATQDNEAHRFEIALFRDRAALQLPEGAAVKAYFIRYSDNYTVLMTGSASGSTASVTLSKACYNKTGQFALIIKLYDGATINTVFYGEGSVYQSATDTIVDDEHIIPSLDDLLAQIDAMEAATNAANTAAGKANAEASAANTAAGEANTAAEEANTAAGAATDAAGAASTAAEKINGLTATAHGLPAGSEPTVQVHDDGQSMQIDMGIPRGDTGEKGDTGATPNIQFRAETGDADTQVEITQSGTPENPVVNLRIPRGRDGTGTGTVTAVTVNGEAHQPDGDGNVDLGEIISAGTGETFEASGNPVTFNGFSGTGMGITASWEPTQAGEGDPSPDNIRPITGRDAVRVTRQEDSAQVDVQMPHTIYGGEVDAATGQGAETWGFVTLDGVGQTHIFSESFRIRIGDNPKPSDLINGICSHTGYTTYDKGKYGITLDGRICVYVPNGDYPITEEGLAQWQNFLKQQHAAGTPVQIAYKLADPVPFTATGGQPITALAGVNTIMTDADSVTVTGCGDVVCAVERLTERVQALEDAPPPTAEDVGARPDTWMPSAADVGARPATWMPTAQDVGARPATWMPTAEDVGARPDNWMPTAQDVGAAEADHTHTAGQVGAIPSVPGAAEGHIPVFNNSGGLASSGISLWGHHRATFSLSGGVLTITTVS